jgi:hypothetical protein
MAYIGPKVEPKCLPTQNLFSNKKHKIREQSEQWVWVFQKVEQLEDLNKLETNLKVTQQS